MNPTTCPALFLTAPSSGQGKTTITAALARLLSRQGKRVRVFKTGPDYLDPEVLAQASGHPVEPLDLWMAGEAWCRQRLYEAACEADIILVEGAMGTFDGDPSSADLAARYGIPLLLVMDVKGMAQTTAAIACGLRDYRSDISFVGLIANHCGSQRHRELIENALPKGFPLLATVMRSDELALPERHLGLVQASEVRDELEPRFEAGADVLAQQPLLEAIDQLAPVRFDPVEPHELEAEQPQAQLANQRLDGVRIGVARDAAFSFIYASNLQTLTGLGAELAFFSPLLDKQLPDVDALWLPGGYPELHTATLSKNQTMLEDLRRFFAKDKPVLAECGGLLYCLDTLTDLENNCFEMAGLLEGDGMMNGKRGCQGMQTAPLPEGDVRAHAHHRSRAHNTPEPIAFGTRARHPAPGEAIFRVRGLTATYLHLFFASNPAAVAALFSSHPISSFRDKEHVAGK